MERKAAICSAAAGCSVHSKVPRGIRVTLTCQLLYKDRVLFKPQIQWQGKSIIY